jgi:hypothetical protein
MIQASQEAIANYIAEAPAYGIVVVGIAER